MIVRTSYESPALLMSERSLQLLAMAEEWIYETECTNRCRRFEGEGTYCNECPAFAPAASGYLACDGYEQDAREEIA